MNEEQNEMLLDLLTKKAIYGLDATEQTQLDKLDSDSVNLEFESLEIAAAAISMVGPSADEPMPDHLRARIVADAESYLATPSMLNASQRENIIESEDGIFTIKPEKPQRSWFGWLGWSVAVEACLAL